MKKIILFYTILMYFFAQSFAQNAKPKNIVMVVAEGFGYGHLSYMYSYSKNKGEFPVSKFEVHGLLNPGNVALLHSSPAIMIANGKMTDRNSTGLDSAGNKIKTLLEIAKEQKKAIGLVSSASVTYALNAVFYAHQKKLDKHESIALDLFNLKPDLIISGGMKYFKDRGDGRDLLIEFRKDGYKILDEKKDLTKGSQLKTLALIANENLDKAPSRGDFYQLAFQKAFKTLIKKDEGYFLVITLPHLDWAGKENNCEQIKSELADFELLLEMLVKFIADDKETLLLVLSSAETGGLNLIDFNNAEIKWATKNRIHALVPVFANGSGAATFSGIFQSSEVYHKIINLLQQ